MHTKLYVWRTLTATKNFTIWIEICKRYVFPEDNLQLIEEHKYQ